MRWFKHYTNMGESTSVNNLIDDCGLNYYAHWMLFLELLSDKFDGKSCEIELNFSVIKRKTRIAKDDKLQFFLEKSSQFFEYKFQIKEKTVLIIYPKLLEIKDNYTKNLQVTSKKVTENFLLEEEKKRKEEEVEKTEPIKKISYTPHHFESDFNELKPKNYKPQTLSGNSYRDFLETVKKYPYRETWLKVIKLAFDSYFVEKGHKVKISMLVKEDYFTKILNEEYLNESYKPKFSEE